VVPITGERIPNVEVFVVRLAEALPDAVSTREIPRKDGTERK
jgi:hypothetical protein